MSLDLNSLPVNRHYSGPRDVPTYSSFAAVASPADLVHCWNLDYFEIYYLSAIGYDETSDMNHPRASQRSPKTLVQNLTQITKREDKERSAMSVPELAAFPTQG